MQEKKTLDPVLQQLEAGIRRFQVNVHAERAEWYQHAATHPQQPHTLVIACADSRVDVQAIVSAGPGELFVTRNIGNMVPVHGEGWEGVSAAVEYAVTVLKVKHAVVCGHSDCGAMKALLDPASTQALPAVRSWLTHAQTALRAAKPLTSGEETPLQRLRLVTAENVRVQMTHLKTHPAVAQAIARGQLTLSGWVYEIGTGDVLIAEDGTSDFRILRAKEARN